MVHVDGDAAAPLAATASDAPDRAAPARVSAASSCASLSWRARACPHCPGRSRLGFGLAFRRSEGLRVHSGKHEEEEKLLVLVGGGGVRQGLPGELEVALCPAEKSCFGSGDFFFA